MGIPRAATMDPATITIARSCVAARGIDGGRIPSYATVCIGAEGTEEDRTGMCYQILQRHDARAQAGHSVHN